MNQNPFAAPKANIDTAPQQAMADIPLILNVAARQKHVLWLLLLNIILVKSQIGNLYVASVLGVLFSIAIYRLASVLELKYQFMYSLLGLMPIVNLIVMFYINRKATIWLKQNGVAVGLLGASSAELRNLELRRL